MIVFLSSNERPGGQPEKKENLFVYSANSVGSKGRQTCNSALLLA